MTKPRSVERVLVVGDAEEGPAERVEVHDARGAVVLRREPGGSLLREQAGVDYHLLTDANGNRSLVEQGVTALNHYDPLGRLIRTDLPNGTFSRVAFDPWQQTSWDPNDNVLASDWYDERKDYGGSDARRRSDGRCRQSRCARASWGGTGW